MKLLMKLSIRSKLILIIMLPVICSLSIMGIAVLAGERAKYKQVMEDHLITIGRIIADRSTAALSFDDKRAAEELLFSLSRESSIDLACIYDHTNTVMAKYSSDTSKNCSLWLNEEGLHYVDGNINLFQSIVLDSERIGALYIRANLNKFNRQQRYSLYWLVFLIIIVSVGCYLIATSLQAIISKPILQLAGIAQRVSEQGDYDVHIPLSLGAEDEVGILTRAFSDMLEQIHKRNIARDLAHQALQESEQDLAVTLNSIGDAVITTDANGLVTRMNPIAEKLTGWVINEAKAQPLKLIFPIINVITREPIESPIDIVKRTGNIVYLSNHTTLITKDGTEHQIADSAAPICDSDGNLIGMVLVFNDVTEQYQLRQAAAKSQRDLQAIMDNSPALIYVKDRSGCYLIVNQKFESQYNVLINNIIGKTDYDLFPADIAVEFRRNDQSVLDAGHSLEFEESVLHDDKLQFYQSIKFPLVDDAGDIYAICGISTNITDRREQEEQLRRTQKMDALGKLTGGIAHDYNNMLGVILGYSGLLHEALEEQPRLAKYAELIQHAGQRGASLTKKLLSFSRKKISDSSVLDINSMLLEERQILEKTLTSRIDLIYDLADDLWSVWLDIGDLEDAVINLSINAMHAIENEGKLTIKTCNDRIDEMNASLLNLSAGDYVQISITDTGSGMDAETKERIFEPFFTTKGDKGTGLGLSQVYGLVDRSHGGIRVYTEWGHGSRFVLYFPRYQLSTHKGKLMETDIIDLNGTETILVVDDEEFLLELCFDILSQKGYHVLKAGNGRQALEMLEKENIDLLLSDIIMSTMSGYQLAVIVRQKYPDVKIQLVSGFDDERYDYNNPLEASLHDNILSKPYTSQSLLICIRGILDQ